jgi:enoyl-CoA hydratase/carnithine racemase
VEEKIEYRVEDGVAHIVLNRPEKLNALDDDSVRLLKTLLYRLDDDDDAHVGIISGNGRAFCAGGDVAQRHSKSREERARLGSGEARDAPGKDLAYGYTKWKPLIAAVHGYCLGLGLHIALMSELIVAAEGTKFQVAEIPRGADAGWLWALLAQRSAGGFAMEMGLTGRMWTAEEALPVRGVDHVTPAGKQVEVAEQIARDLIMKNPPLAIRALVRARRGVTAELQLRHLLVRPTDLHLSEDYEESATAFREKRPPVYHAR